MAPKYSDWEIEAQTRAMTKKTHVSFPQLKYPSLRDSGLKDPVQWITGKALDDGAEGLWRVHDKLYDLTSFINKHPGGAEWLELTKSVGGNFFYNIVRQSTKYITLWKTTPPIDICKTRDIAEALKILVTKLDSKYCKKGTDITEAFESHHISSTAEKLLDKFYIKDARIPRNSPFTFKDHGFYRTLKREVQKELKTIPAYVTKTTNSITDGLFLTLFFSSAMATWIKNYWMMFLWYIVASIALALLTVACHNFVHRRTNWRMYLFNMSMWSYRDFRVSHVLSHHLYTNTLMDFEISSLEPLLFYNPRKDKPFYARIGFITEFFFFPFIFLVTFGKRLLSAFVRPGFFKQHYRWHDAIGFLLPLWMWLITRSSFSHVLYTWLWINCTGSLIFHLIAANAAHQHPDAIKDGDQPKDETPDWGAHQVEALLDRKDVNGSTFAVVTLFGEHALHHMFPTLDHATLKYLHPLFVKICEKYQANYRTSTQFNMVIGQIKETMRTKFKTLED